MGLRLVSSGFRFSSSSPLRRAVHLLARSSSSLSSFIYCYCRSEGGRKAEGGGRFSQIQTGRRDGGRGPRRRESRNSQRTAQRRSYQQLRAEERRTERSQSRAACSGIFTLSPRRACLGRPPWRWRAWLRIPSPSPTCLSACGSRCAGCLFQLFVCTAAVLLLLRPQPE